MHHISRFCAAFLSCAVITGTMTAGVSAENQVTFIEAGENGSYTEVYSVSESNVSEEGWYTRDGGETFSYYYKDGSFASGSTVLPDGYTYIFTSDGTLRTGWQLAGGTRYYYNPLNGQIQFGWVSYMSKTYYVDPQEGKLTGSAVIDGAACEFDQFGALVSMEEPEEPEIPEEEKSGISYYVPYYAQADERWGSVYIGTKTIAKVGCLTSCMAMMHSYYTETEITPDVMCKQYLTYSNNSLLWASVYNLGYEVVSIAGRGESTNLQDLYNRLQTGPVVVGATNAYGGMHYVLVTGCTKNSPDSLTKADFLIHDPGYTNKTTLDEHFADYGSWYQFYSKPL